MDNSTLSSETGARLIAILSMLFIASLVSERIANFIKLRFPQLNKTQLDPAKEIKRQYRIQWIALGCGLLTAAIFNLDVIYVLQNIDTKEMNQLIGWSAVTDWSAGGIMVILLGIVLTGVFLSFGSKFWHDLLDLILQVKNYRRKMVEEQTYDFDTADELEASLDISDKELMQSAIEQNMESLKKSVPSMVSIFPSVDTTNSLRKPAIEIHIQDSKVSQVPSKLYYKRPNGKIASFSTSVIPEVDIPKIQVGDGDIIYPDGATERGTCSCIVRDPGSNKFYLLTCCHVLTDGNLSETPEGGKRIYDDDEGDIVGTFYKGWMNSAVDVGLVEVDENYIASLEHSPVAYYAKEVVTAGKKVEFTNSLSNTKAGVIINAANPQPIEIKYKNGTQPVENLIIISETNNKFNYKTISQGGDSGTLLYDQQNKHALGMIIAGNSKFTYAIPFTTVMQTIKMNLY